MVGLTLAELKQFISELPPAVLGPRRFIYGLLDPETEELRYVGKSIRPADRFQNHMNERSNCHRSHWLQSLKKRGLVPEILIFEATEGEWPWQESERFWISYFKQMGCPLTNNTSGGDGVPDLPPETRARMAAANRGRRMSPEAIERNRLARLGYKHSAATKAKMSVSQRGRKITWIAKIGEANRKLTPAQEADVRQRLANNETVTSIARDLDMHRTSISKVKKGTYR